MNMETNGLFPMFVDLNGKKIVVYGAGKIAGRRINTLLMFGADITVVAPTCLKEIEILAKENKINLLKRQFEAGEISDCFFVLAATSDKEINDIIYNECEKKGILVNIASDLNKCDFHFPGIAKKDNIVIGVNAGGKNHKKAKEITVAMRNYIKENI